MALLSYSRAARDLGIDRRDLPVLVRIMGIEPKRVDTNGMAKGLDREDMDRLRRALKGRMKRLVLRAI